VLAFLFFVLQSPALQPQPDRRWGSPPIILSDGDHDGVKDILLMEASTEQGSVKTWLLSGRTGTILFANKFPARRFLNSSIACGRDLDADGWEDLVSTDGSLIAFHSSRTGEFLQYFDRSSQGPQNWGVLSNAGDFDQDGVPDLLVVRQPARDLIPDGEFASVFSGIDGHALLTVRDTRFFADVEADICAIADQNGDGKRDLVMACEVESTGAGDGKVISGKDGSIIRTLERFPSAPFRLQDAGDLDGDGVNDVLVGSGARIYSGCNGQRLFEERQVHPLEQRGDAAVACFAGSKGEAYLLIGAPDSNVAPNMMWSGYVQCWSLLDRRKGFVSHPSQDDDVWHFGTTITIFDDADSDGTPDFVCCPDHSMCGNPARMYVCSGRTGKILWSAVRTLTGVDVER
jgi:hypothetical protein